MPNPENVDNPAAPDADADDSVQVLADTTGEPPVPAEGDDVRVQADVAEEEDDDPADDSDDPEFDPSQLPDVDEPEDDEDDADTGDDDEDPGTAEPDDTYEVTQ